MEKPEPTFAERHDADECGAGRCFRATGEQRLYAGAEYRRKRAVAADHSNNLIGGFMTEKGAFAIIGFAVIYLMEVLAIHFISKFW